MSLTQNLFILFALILASAFFSIAEIALAASRRLRLRQMADDGDARAEKVMRIQEDPGHYFTVVQIGVNAIAVAGGIVGEGMLSPYVAGVLAHWMSSGTADTAGFVLSFLIVTSLFVLCADLIPKRVSMVVPEALAVRVAGPMMFMTALFRPAVWIYARLTDLLMKLLHLPQVREDRVTPDDILALAEAGAQSGALARREQQVIENVFELDTRTVPSAMTHRERIAYFLRDDPDAVIRARITEEPFSTYPVCDGDIDHVIGYVDAKDLFQRVLKNQPLSLADESLVHKVLIVPDRLTLAEVLDQFRQVGEDFAIIVNEYSLVVGLVTLNDVMSTVMGDLVSPWYEEQIVRRDDNSWLIDGVTPIADVKRVLGIDELLNEADYDTLAGFLMEMLRRVPRRTDTVTWGGYRFEVMDVDAFRIDQVMVTRVVPEAGS
ncbi:hemolysin family protein [Methyloversatilis thermotolerans]|uniref:hemolysin family protein n=1 Tax=Methyloversatilis thermotolerans TaxID=1346290 RepID=UPI000377BFE1|nr:hemolysin family protein [Methyloversatilis thermotolerans]